MSSKQKAPKQMRGYRSEAGLPALKTKKKSPLNKRPSSPVPESEHDSEPEHSDSSVQSFLSISEKDDSRRKAPKRKVHNKRDQNTRPIDAHQEAEPPKATGALLALALSFRTGFNTITYPERSEYIPDVYALFTVLKAMTNLVSANSLLHEKFPAFTSVGLNLYYAHAVFFTILRTRDNVGVLTREERRALRKYEAVGPAESWQIASPLTSFFQALGSVTPPGGKYGTIVPRLPDYSAMMTGAAGTGLARLHHVRSIGRLPIVPALHQFLHNIGENATSFAEGILYPVANPTLGAGNRRFLGLDSSAADSAAFHVLSHSAGWTEPTEDGVDTYTMIMDQKRSIVRKWKIPEHANTAELNDIEKFLGLNDAMSSDWLRRLLELSSQVNRFFPESINLASIPTFTQTETISSISVVNPEQRTLVADLWYVAHSHWKLSLQGKTVNDDSQLAYQMALTTRVRPTYDDLSFAAPIRNAFMDRDHSTGSFTSYFDPATSPRTEMECISQPDPTHLAQTYIQDRIYDPKPHA